VVSNPLDLVKYWRNEMKEDWEIHNEKELKKLSAFMKALVKFLSELSRTMISLSKENLESVFEWFSHLNNKCRIEALEDLARRLNKELWVLRRSGEKANE